MLTQNNAGRGQRRSGFLRLAVLMACFLGMASVMAQDTNWYVAPPPAGRDDGSYNGQSWSEPFASISNAIRWAATDAGHVIHVSNGTYTLSAAIDVNKGVHIRGVNLPGQTNTIIEGGGADRCCRIRHANAVVEGVVITKGATAEGYGGGVYFESGVLRDTIVISNTGVRGGGIWAMGGSVISNCTICENTSNGDGGGGVCLVGAAQLLDSRIFENVNSSAVYGSGVYLRGVDGALVAGCDIARNLGPGGGVGFYIGPSAVVSNCTICHHTNTHGGLYALSATLSVYDSTIVSNVAHGVYIGGAGSVVLDGCLIEHNQNSDSLGAGVTVLGMGLITNCTVRYNRAFSSGAGVNYYFASSGIGSGTITHSRVTGNILDGNGTEYCNGAGLRVSRNQYGVLIENCEFRDNLITNASRAYGGGLSLGSNVIVRNCLVADNRAEGASAALGGLGGGVYIAPDAANLLEACTIAGNFALRDGGGMYLDGAGGDTLVNTIVCTNQIGAGVNNWYFGDANRKTNVTYTCTPEADGTWGAGCVGADPQFADPDAGNYRLLSGSPGMHAGTNLAWMTGAYDLDGRPRLDRFTRLADMGCYEFVPPGTMYMLK